MTRIERVKKLCKWLIFDGFAENDSNLAEKLGYTKSSFSQIINEKVPLSDKFIETLCSVNDNINKVWIYEGKGNMLKSENTYKTLEKNQPLTLSEPIKNEYDTDYKPIPLIPVEAMAGYMAGDVQVMEFETKRFVVPTFKGADYLISVRGSSMYPKYNSGDIVACKHLPLDTFFQWNKVYVMDTLQGVLIKRVCKGSDEDHVLIVSDNKSYDSFELHRREIRSLAIVMGVIRLE